MMVQGPVRVETPDGRIVESDRFVVAICTCRRSKTYPLCDTSHRRSVAPTRVQTSGRRNELDPETQLFVMWAANRSSTRSRARIPKTTSRSSWGSLLEQVTDDVGPHHLFVHRVGLDMLGVELDARRRRLEALQRLH